MAFTSLLSHISIWKPGLQLVLSLYYIAVNNSCFSSLFCRPYCNLTLSILRCLVVGCLSVACPSGRNGIHPRHLSHFLSPNHNSKHHYGFAHKSFILAHLRYPHLYLPGFSHVTHLPFLPLIVSTSFLFTFSFLTLHFHF